MQTAYAQAPRPELDGRGLSIGLVVARYNWHITGNMLALARATLLAHDVAERDIHVAYVPGSYELASAAQALAARGICQALICCGCIFKGATRHDVLVGDAAAQGIQRVALDNSLPVIFGVICAENQQQALERIGRARECAEAALEMVHTLRQIREGAI